MVIFLNMNDNKTLNMPEWQKLQAGEIYNDFDQDLFNRRIEAKQLFRAYNRTVLYSTVVKSRLATTLLLVRMSASTMPTMYSMPRNALLVD